MTNTILILSFEVKLRIYIEINKILVKQWLFVTKINQQFKINLKLKIKINDISD